MNNKRHCQHCGRELPKGRTRYCSDACAKAAQAGRARANTGKPRGNQGMMWHTICVSCSAEIFRPVQCIRCKACQDVVNAILAATSAYGMYGVTFAKLE